MAEIRIFDSLFSSFAESCTLRSENAGFRPTHFSWRKDGPITSPVFFTDFHIPEVATFGSDINAVALLLEPICLRDDHYKAAEQYKDYYRAILTFDKRLLDDDKYLLYIKGGSSIQPSEWGLCEKQYNLSIVVSHKRELEGHKLRHEIVAKFGDKIDGIFGTGYEQIDSKFIGHAPYRYSIVIENCSFPYYFTEQSIDAMCLGTVPIYCGNPEMTTLFNTDGMIAFDTLEDLEKILPMLSEKDYESRLPAIKENIKLCKNYAIAEDWIWRKYPELFE